MRINQIKKCFQKVHKNNRKGSFPDFFLQDTTNIIRTFSSSLLRAIIACNYLTFFKIFSNFVHFCSSFQIFWPFSGQILFQNIFRFCTFLFKFSNILTIFNIYLPFFFKIAPMPMLSRIDPDNWRLRQNELYQIFINCKLASLNPIPQNGQTHSSNSSANWQRILWVCLTILW